MAAATLPLDPPRLIALPDRPERTPLTSEAVYPEPEWHAETAHG